MNLRPLEQAHKLGNRFGLVPLVLPIGIENPIERVYEVRRRMNALKGSTQPLLAFGLLAVAGLLIKPAQDAMLSLFGKKTTAVMTNVPGPREKLKSWVPRWSRGCSGCRSPATSGWAFHPELWRRRSVRRDHRHDAVPRSAKDHRRVRTEFARLSLVTLMLPWGE